MRTIAFGTAIIGLEFFPMLAQLGEPAWLTGGGMTVCAGLLFYVFSVTMPKMSKDNKEMVLELGDKQYEGLKELTNELKEMRIDVINLLKQSLFKDMGS